MPVQTEGAEGAVNVDPLVSLGLIDPKMLDAEPGSNYVVPEQGEPAESATPAKAEASDLDKANARIAELEARVNAPAPAVSALGGRSFDDDVSRLDAHANAALAEAIAQNSARPEGQRVGDGVINALVKAEHGRLVAEARSFWDRAVLAPTAHAAAAAKAAKEMSTPQVKITADDLMGETSVDGMKARARALLETRRGTNFAARTAKGADRVEGGASPGSVDQKTIDGLDPFNKIKLGLLRSK